jgi:hemolysin III
VWGLAIAGVVFKSLALGQFPAASATVYVLMGWCVVFALRPLLHAISWHGMMWLAAGGIAYTLGILFFAFDRLRYFHALWHLFVMAGSVAQYFAVLLYVVPARR